MMLIELTGVIARGIVLAAMVGVSGAVVFQFAVLRRWPQHEHSVHASWPRLITRAGLIAALTILLVAPARLYVQARGLVDDTDPVAPMMANVLRTLWGKGLCLQAAAALLAAIAFVIATRAGRTKRAGWWMALAAALGLTATPAFMGHASASEQFRTLALFADWIHITAAGGWIGSLLMLALCARTVDADDHVGTYTATLISLFHPVALTSATLLMASGLTSSLLHVRRLGDLTSSTYGLLLSTKLVLTAVVAAIGFYHSRRGPTLARTHQRGSLQRSLATEVLLAVLVISVTAVLVGTSPPTSDREGNPHDHAARTAALTAEFARVGALRHMSSQ
ncbi:MAG: CopD family protein [bacterium]